jgi:AsmA protein
LLSKNIVVNEVNLSGLQATLIKYKNGTTNIDDLLSKDEKTSAEPEDQKMKFDIAAVHVQKANLTYHDEGSGAKYAIKNLNLNTGRIANGVPSKIDLTLTAQANQPKLDINAQLSSVLTFDLDKQNYQLDGLNLEVAGDALDISKLKIAASGDASANPGEQQYSAKNFALDASGIKGKDNFAAQFAIPALAVSREKISAEKLTLNARLDGAFGKLVASSSLPSVESNGSAFKIEALNMDLDVTQPDQAFKVKLTSPVSGNLKTQQLNLSNLTIALNATGDKLPNKSVSSEMKGNVQIDAIKQSVQANLAGGLLQSQVRAKLGVTGFDNPAIRFDVDADQFDADLYLPKNSASATTAKPSQPEQPIDLSALRKLNLEGSLRIGALKIANVKSSQVHLDVKAHNGLVNLNPFAANLYQGSTSGSVSINAQATPNIAVKQSLKGVNVAELAKDAADFDMLEGRGNIAVDVTTQGNTVTAFKKALNGNLSLNLVDGAIKGINIAKKMRDAKAMLGKGNAESQTQAADKNEKTDFSELKATFKISNGVAHNDDLSLKSPLLRLGGAGDINIGNDSMNYVAKATLAGTMEGQGGKDSVGGITVPVRISGPYTDLKYSLDFGALVSGAAKQKIEAKKEEVKAKVEDKVKDKLKGLFK